MERGLDRTAAVAASFGRPHSPPSLLLHRGHLPQEVASRHGAAPWIQIQLREVLRLGLEWLWRRSGP